MPPQPTGAIRRAVQPRVMDDNNLPIQAMDIDLDTPGPHLKRPADGSDGIFRFKPGSPAMTNAKQCV